MVCEACEDEMYLFRGMGIRPCAECRTFIRGEEAWEDELCHTCYKKSGYAKHCRTKQCK